MPATIARLRRIAILTFALLVAFLGIAPAALAEPAGSGRVADAPRLTLRDLGTDPTLAFYGLQGAQQLTIPVPPGLRPAALTAEVELPVNLVIGSITVTQDERTISRSDLPAADRAPIRLPLDGVEIRDNAVTVQVRTNLVPPQGYCVVDGSDPLKLSNTALEYAGVERPPTTVADFLPPILQRLTIFVPDKPSMAEADAAVKMTASVVAHYGDQAVRVGVAPLVGDDPLPAAAPFERQIVIREGPEPAVSLLGSAGVPSLLVTGPAGELANQTRLLASGDLVRLALSSRAVVGPLKDAPVLPANSTTMRELGQPELSATALTNPQVTVGLDQTRLGRAAKRIRVHLFGSYTPLPQNLSGQVVVSVNGEQVDRWAADGGGTIDRWIDVPDRLLQRYNNLGVAVNAAGNTGQCGQSAPITVTVDGDTTITSEPADPPVPAGFQSIPQALMPRVEIGVTEDLFADTSRAAIIVAGLQRMSALPIDTAVVGLQDAIGSPNPAVLIAAEGWTDDRVVLPVNASGDTVSLDAADGSGEPVSLTIDPRLRYGSLQAVYTDGRTVLVATSNRAAPQLDSLLGWLNEDSRRWDRLTGAAVLSAPDQQPVTVSAELPPPPAPAPPEEDSMRYWLVGGGVLAAVLLGAVIYVRTRNETGA